MCDIETTMDVRFCFFEKKHLLLCTQAYIHNIVLLH